MKICSKCIKVFPDDESFCDACGAKLFDVADSGRKRRIWPTIVFPVLLAVSVIVIIVLCIGKSNIKSTLHSAEMQNKKLSEKADGYEDKILELEKQVADYKIKADADEKELEFYNTCIGLIVDTEGNDYYHKYSCEDFLLAKKFWGYNVEQAKAKGYKPCPKCFNEG